ncbi:MAG TPA: DUF4136 domain-containing protein [Rhodanobacteraceae bacterium]|nr:DUF4136 domain-containing protein [Rhodanobacteraceae bacterium]
MKLCKSLVLTLLCISLVVLATSAAAKPKVRADYDHSTNFAGYKTFGFISPPGTEVDGYPAEITNDVKASIRHQLESHGYRYVDASPDLLVNFSAKLANQSQNDETKKQQLGYYGYRRGNQVPVYKTWSTYTYDKSTKDYVEGTLNVDIVDAKASQLVWEGVAIGEVKNLDRSVSDLKPGIDRVVSEIFAKYPFRAGK